MSKKKRINRGPNAKISPSQSALANDFVASELREFKLTDRQLCMIRVYLVLRTQIQFKQRNFAIAAAVIALLFWLVELTFGPTIKTHLGPIPMTVIFKFIPLVVLAAGIISLFIFENRLRNLRNQLLMIPITKNVIFRIDQFIRIKVNKIAPSETPKVL